MKEFFGVILAVVVMLVMFLVSLVLTVVAGYFVGVILAVTPFINDMLYVDHELIPVLTAWFAVAGLFFKSTVTTNGGGAEE